MALTLSNLAPEYISYYMDDIFIYYNKENKDLNILEQLFQTPKTGPRLSLDKSVFINHENLALKCKVEKYE